MKKRRIVAAVFLGRGKAVRQSSRLIKEHTLVEPAKLKDEEVEVRTLVG